MSGYLLGGKTKNRKANRVGDKIVTLMQPLSDNKRRTLTLDNGKEFATHCKVSQRLEMNIYFAHPYCSWERGTNENTNGLIRQFIPKGTDLHFVSHQEVAQYVDLINDRPRKRLGYRTPREVFDNVQMCCV